MVDLEIRKATKKQRKARIAFSGPSGSGKSRSAMELAKYICDQEGGRFLVVDTEAGSAEDYAHLYDFDVMPLISSFSPDRYVQAIHAGEAAGYTVIILDSISHEWSGPGGCLDMIDRSNSHNKYTAWAPVTEKHNGFIAAMLWSPAHIIATIREKEGYAQDKDPDTGKTVINKLGLQPIQREGMDYEFQVVMKISQDHIAQLDKGRCDELEGKVWDRPGADFAEAFYGWLKTGVADRQGAIDAVKRRWMAAAQGIGLLSEKPSATEIAAFKEHLGEIFEALDATENGEIDRLGIRGIERIAAWIPPTSEEEKPSPTRKRRAAAPVDSA
jgi:hypothetical protein